MSDLTSHTRDDLDFLPSDCEMKENWNMVSRWVDDARKELPAPIKEPECRQVRMGDCKTEAPCRGRRGGTIIYTINSNRSRYQIIRDYARRHNLTVSEIDQLVRALPDYGAQSMLAGSVAALNVSAEIINLAAARAERARRRG